MLLQVQRMLVVQAVLLVTEHQDLVVVVVT
jgi:hypothetical protein